MPCSSDGEVELWKLNSPFLCTQHRHRIHLAAPWQMQRAQGRPTDCVLIIASNKVGRGNSGHGIVRGNSGHFNVATGKKHPFYSCF